MRVGVIQEFPDMFNPVLYSYTNYPLYLWSSLIQWDEDLQLVSDLAEEWSVSPDGKTLTYVLREGLKFSDGHPLTSEDVAFTVKFATEESTTWNNLYRYSLEPSEETKSGNAVIEGAVETPDDRTVIFHLSEPSSTVLTEYGGFNVFPKHVYEGHDLTVEKDYLSKNYVSSGAFILKEYVPGDHWWLVRNEFYHTPSYLDGIIFQLYADNAAMEIALLNNELDQIWG